MVVSWRRLQVIKSVARPQTQRGISAPCIEAQDFSALHRAATVPDSGSPSCRRKTMAGVKEFLAMLERDRDKAMQTFVIHIDAPSLDGDGTDCALKKVDAT